MLSETVQTIKNRLETLQKSQTVTINQVSESLEAFKNSTTYVSFLETQIKKNKDAIIQQNYNDVLRPIFNKEYPQPGNYCWAISIPLKPNTNQYSVVDSKIEFIYSTKYGAFQDQYIFSNVIPTLTLFATNLGDNLFAPNTTYTNLIRQLRLNTANSLNNS